MSCRENPDTYVVRDTTRDPRLPLGPVDDTETESVVGTPSGLSSARNYNVSPLTVTPRTPRVSSPRSRSGPHPYPPVSSEGSLSLWVILSFLVMYSSVLLLLYLFLSVFGSQGPPVRPSVFNFLLLSKRLSRDPT